MTGSSSPAMINPLKNYPGYTLRRASTALMAQLAKQLLALKLRPTEATVLMLIDANPGITQSDIGKALDIASANMAPLISRLDDRKLVERQPVDGRSQGLSLSRAGKTLVAKVKTTVEAHENMLLEKIPAAHRSAFLISLQALWNE